MCVIPSISLSKPRLQTRRTLSAASRCHPPHIGLPLHAIFDKCLIVTIFSLWALAKSGPVPAHDAMVPSSIHDLADHTGGRKPCNRARSTDPSVCPCTPSRPLPAALERENMARPRQIAGLTGSSPHDRRGSIRRRDPGCNVVPRIDGHSESRAESRRVLHRLLREVEFFHPLRRQGKTDPPTAYRAMKLMAWGVTWWAAMTESPSFSDLRHRRE